MLVLKFQDRHINVHIHLPLYTWVFPCSFLTKQVCSVIMETLWQLQNLIYIN